MYDYVTMLLFDEGSSLLIQTLKDKLKTQGVNIGRKAWPPHITVDLFKNIPLATLLDKTDILIKDVPAFNVTIQGFGDFNKRVLFLKPQANDNFQNIKAKSDALLAAYSIEQNKRPYYPHVTLAYGQTVNSVTVNIETDFLPINATILFFAVYNRQLVLQKKYQLLI